MTFFCRIQSAFLLGHPALRQGGILSPLKTVIVAEQTECLYCPVFGQTAPTLTRSLMLTICCNASRMCCYTIHEGGKAYKEEGPTSPPLLVLACP